MHEYKACLLCTIFGEGLAMNTNARYLLWASPLGWRFIYVKIKHTGCVVSDIPMQDSFYLHTTMATIRGNFVELGKVDYVNTNAVLVVD